MLETARDFFVNREWALAVGVLTTLVTTGEELLESVSVLASEHNDWTPMGLIPLVAAIIIRLRVWSDHSVKEIENHL
jgi:hypothetical protein